MYKKLRVALLTHQYGVLYARYLALSTTHSYRPWHTWNSPTPDDEWYLCKISDQTFANFRKLLSVMFTHRPMLVVNPRLRRGIARGRLIHCSQDKPGFTVKG